MVKVFNRKGVEVYFTFSLYFLTNMSLYIYSLRLIVDTWESSEACILSITKTVENFPGFLNVISHKESESARCIFSGE